MTTCREFFTEGGSTQAVSLTAFYEFFFYAFPYPAFASFKLIMTMILFSSVLPFEYGDKDWRVAIKLMYRNMVQESRHNLKS